MAVPPAATPTFAPVEAGSALVTTYPPETVKRYLSERFLLPGMEFGAGEKPQYGGQAVFSNRSDLATADPMVNVGISNDNILSSITGDGSLLRAKSSNVFEAEPYLAQSWTVSDDFKVWTFSLRTDVLWHDGVALTAEDIKYWIDLALFPPAGRRLAITSVNLGPLKEAQVLDEHTVRLIYKDPVPFLAETLYQYSTVVSHPKHLAKPIIDNGNVGVQISDFGWVGLGPYKYDLYQKGSNFRVVRFDRYFEKDFQGRALPYLDSILFPIIPDGTVAVSAFRAGRIDGTSRGTGHHLTPDMVATVKKTLGDGAWFARLPYVAWGTSFNATKPPFNNLDLRRAVTLFADRQQQIQLVFGGFGLESGIMVPGSYWANPDFRTWPGYNPATKGEDQAEAKRLLKASGYEGATIEVLCRDSWVAHCEFLDLTLRGLGVHPKLNVMDQLRLQEMTQSGAYTAKIGNYDADLPAQALVRYLTTNSVSADKFGDTRIDDMNRQIATTLDPIARRQALFDAEYYMIVEKAYIQPWSREEAVIGFRSYIKGVWVPGTKVHNLNDHRTTWIDAEAR